MLHGYTDFDWARSVVDRKSTSRCFFSLGSTMIYCSSLKQGSMALSNIEAKYILACDASREVV